MFLGSYYNNIHTDIFPRLFSTNALNHYRLGYVNVSSLMPAPIKMYRMHRVALQNDSRLDKDSVPVKINKTLAA